jgi:CRISPR/Cas system-associated exonuclease Cas4 (RecB family)
MARLENSFSWSHSAAGAFESCRRKRYWSKYAAWGGWERQADPLCRTAYRLNKMTNRFCLYGIAAEDCVVYMLDRHQQGKHPTDEEVFDAVARPQLRKAWDESTQRQWRQHPKKACLHEHYYPDFCGLSEREVMEEIATVVKTCIGNFRAEVLPRLAEVTAEMVVPVGGVGKGEPEHFFLGGIKIYAIPDYVYVEDGVWHILDWKSGKAKPEHAEQIALYALWAREKHGVAPEQVRLRLEYLFPGEHLDVPVDGQTLLEVCERIQESVQDMSQYLEGGDLERNRPLPKAEWELCYEPSLCRGCEFFELCKPELQQAYGAEFDSAFRGD